MADLFLSYSRLDGEFVRRLASALQARGKDVWVDVDGIRTRYFEAGSGRRVVLVHGGTKGDSSGGANAEEFDLNFAELAKKKSKDPGASDGGDLGFFTKEQMVPEFSAVAFTLEPGKISDPVKSQFGWHVIKVEERRPIGVKSFEEMKQALQEKLYKEQLEHLTEQHVQSLRAQAVVETKL